MTDRNQAAWDALRRENAELAAERDDLLLAVDRCEETKTALHMNLREARRERDELAAQVEVMRDALEHYMENGITSQLYYKARNALALPNTAGDILRQRDARTLRDAAHVFDNEAGLAGCDNMTTVAGDRLRKMAKELEAQHG